MKLKPHTIIDLIHKLIHENSHFHFSLKFCWSGNFFICLFVVASICLFLCVCVCVSVYVLVLSHCDHKAALKLFLCFSDSFTGIECPNSHVLILKLTRRTLRGANLISPVAACSQKRAQKESETQNKPWSNIYVYTYFRIYYIPCRH